MTGQTSTIQTEADALRDILSWSQDRPAWQRDALRRLVLEGELSSTDFDELTALCKDSSLPGEPLVEGHISAQQTGAPTVSLKNLRGVQNVNALADGQSLNFIPKGVTIIYGDNGTGKSGYVRILKRACRARTAKGKEEPILPNIYDNSTGVQRAELEYQAGAQSQKAEWKNGESTDDLLSEVSVFDSRTANVHVEETNDLAYTPFPMKLLERLVNACKNVKEQIDGEIATIKAQTPKSILNPACSPETGVGKLLNSLNKDTKPEAVTEIADLSDVEQARLAELTADFAQDPKAAARRLRAQKTRLETLQSALEVLSVSISPENVETLRNLETDLKTKYDAAKLASQELSKDEPLEGVGSDVWRTLWEAARTFSTKYAYTSQEFPVVDDNARCVLCQQELDQNAAKRLERFEAFVQDQTQREADAACRKLNDFRDSLIDTAISHADDLKERRFLSDELGNAMVAAAYRKFVILAKWRLRQILLEGTEVSTVAPELSEVGSNAIIDGLETRAKALLADDDSDERKLLRAELAELKDRQWLSGIKDDILAQIMRLNSIAELETAQKDTRTNTITSKNTALSEALVTERLRGQFAQEIDHLKLPGLAIELTQAGSQHGVSRFKVSLMQNKSKKAGKILSEGEYRCVALAGFMAELATNDSDSGIIFDDPVSSLDHLHREAIAKRLAAEGRSRQVIVFTHDLPFFFLLRNACTRVDDSAHKTDIALRHIQKRPDGPGYCRNETPDKAKKVSESLKAMRKHLSNVRVQYDNDPDSTDWLISSRGIVNSLRQTWEAAVEKTISDVLERFSSKVNTKGFAKLSAITEADATTMRQHYGQCSVLLHKISDALNPVAPTPEDIANELEALEQWLSAVLDRQGKIRAA